MLKKIFSNIRRKKNTSTHVKKSNLEIDDISVRRYLPDGKIEEAHWENLIEVGIVTTDEGPFVDDVYMLLIEEGWKTGCSIPITEPQFRNLLERVQELPGFDNETFIQAMSCSYNNKFVCWKKGNNQ